MTPSPLEQRTAYKGTDPRPWVRARLVAADGATLDVEFVADTGNPFGLIVDDVTLARFQDIPISGSSSNFGTLVGGFVRLEIPDIGFSERVPAYANNRVVVTLQLDCPDFDGLLGLPILRMMEYGGDADEFWIRPAKTTP